MYYNLLMVKQLFAYRIQQNQHQPTKQNILIFIQEVRTTNNQDYKVIESNGILIPEEQKIIQIVALYQTIPKAKFQIMTTILKDHELPDTAFQGKADELIQKAILKTSSLDDSNSVISDKSFLMSVPPPRFSIPNSGINNFQSNTPQYTIFHLLFVGILCLLFGYAYGRITK
ncbi:hypothetical protein pb186bvf_007030 [Paramecium bursaria]